MNRCHCLPVCCFPLLFALFACGASSDEPTIPADSPIDGDDTLREVGPIDDLPTGGASDDSTPETGSVSPTDPGTGSATPICGDGVRDAAEECDGVDLITGACGAFGWSGTGELTCNASCLLEAARCDTGLCGNGEIDPGEECDGGPSRRSPACSLDCRIADLLETEPNDDLGTADLIAAAVDSERRLLGHLQPGDVDLFQFTITEPVELLAYTSDGSGDCDVDTVMALGDPDGVTLVEDDDGGLSPCSQIDAQRYPSAALSRPGTYYLAVGGFFDMETGPYTLHVSLRRPVCGDRRLSAGEECDDGNLTDEDGCDGQCRYEALEEVEPNDSPGEPDGPHIITAAAPMLLRGELEAGDVDVFAVPMERGDSFTRIEIMAAGPSCDTDVALTLLGPDGETVLASDSDAWGSSCALLASSEDFAVGDLQAGTHYIEVAQYGARAGTYLLNVVTHQAECGNGLREGDEMCDDANDDASDGCDVCQLDADPEVEPNDDLASATDLGRFDETRTTILAGHLGAADIDFFALQVLDDARLELWTDDGGDGCEIDTVLELSDSAGEPIAYNDDGGVSPCSRLDKTMPEMRGLEAGTYLVEVSAYYNGDVGFYALHVGVRYPSCGDGVIEGAEICDDENDEDGDGCSAVCRPEGAAELEPNDALDDAIDALDLSGEGEVLVAGSVSVAGDVDFYRVAVPEGAQLGARLWNGSGGCAVDSRVSLRSDAATVLRSGVALADDEGCWQIGGVSDPWSEGEGLAAGEYLLRVAGRDGDTGAYQLVLWADVE